MRNGSPFIFKFGRYGRRVYSLAGSSGGWLLMVPGLSLILLGIAILIWPELLAYMVAGLLLMAGSTIAFWGWQIYQRQKRMLDGRHSQTYHTEDTFSGPFN